ncbi:MAG: GspMb/PilO family protein [Rugosibacter sp.]|nr:GspMb/PilO family protein [Rugosibacter sp.]
MLRNITAHLRFQFYRHGWPAAIGLVLVVSAIGWQIFGVAALRTQTASLRAEQSALRKQIAAQAEVQANPQNTPGRRLDALYASLPVAADTLAAVEAIHQAAAANGVKLAQGEYRLARDAGMPWLRYQITLPMQASYPQLRAWLVDVMNAMPTVALDEINFRRDDAGSPAVESRMRLTLFLKAG